MSEAPPCEYGARCTPDDPCGLHEAQAAPPIPPVEKGPDDAPVWFDAAEASAWAQGYNAALDDLNARASDSPAQTEAPDA